MAAIAPVHFFSPSAEARAAAATAAQATAAAAAATAAGTTTAASAATATDFNTILGQLLAELGPLSLDTSLANIGENNNGGNPVGGLTNTVFTLLLFNSLGLGKITSQPTVQQLLLVQLLLGATGTNDTLGLGSLATEQLATSLVQAGVGNTNTTNNLLTQLTNVSTQPNPILFSAGALAQAFQIGNGIGLPA
jgi:3-oxoacyl-ACP reductase-like protein